MTMSDLEKGFTYSAASVADEPLFPRNPTNPRDDMECWNAEFFKRLQSFSDAEFTGFSRRTRILEFRQLSRVYLTYLEWMLLQEMRVFKDNLDDPARAQAKVERIGEMLRNYSTTVRDLEFVRQHDYQSTEQRVSTFQVYREIETKIYGLLYGKDWGVLPVTADSPVNSRKLSGNYEPNTLSHFFHSADQHKKSLRNMIRRFIIAMLGGIVLIVPMLIMILYQTRITGVVTVSVATFFFAACVAVFSKVDGLQLLTAVATYAAVLVVFVGANGS